MAIDHASPFLSFVSDGLKWTQKHIGYATKVKSEMRKLKEEMGKLENVCVDVDGKVDTAHERFQPVKEQVDGWQSRVREFKVKVAVDFELPLNCSCAVRCPNCWTRYKHGKRVVLEHKEDVAKLINEGKEYSNGTVVDPNLPSPVETNIRSIQEEAKRLWDLEADINSKVEATKRERLLLPKRQVEGWIKRVSEQKKDVSAIQSDFEEMEKSDIHMKSRWVQLSERAENLLKKIKELISEERSFEDVADPSRPTILVEQAKVHTIGQDDVYDRVLSLIRNGHERRIGIHGMGGTGKTTLLKRINNSFTENDFELIIWVSVSHFTNAEIQQSIMQRCGMKVGNDKAHEMESKIREFLKGKRYVLLLDDVWKTLDLNSLGVPTGDNEVKSMILITSRSEDVCDRMEATKVEVGCLNPENAWELFTAKVGKAILASDPKIRELAEKICQYCGGLPLALEVIGMAMSGKHDVSEWNDAKNTLEKHSPRFEDSEEKLFSRLKLSYDNLKNDTIRECFCYSALFREDWKIDTFYLVSCWTGEGLFDDECDTIDAAREKGYTIIRELIKASLLKEVEDGRDETSAILNKMIDEWKVVMHDVLRDMALWIRKDEFKISKGRSGFGKISGKEARLGLTTFEKGDSMESRRQLLQFGKSAPNLSTLITTGVGATLFTDDMLEAMNKLRVLYVYGEYRCELPHSIGRLRDLRCLNLSSSTLLSSPKVLVELRSLRLLIVNVSYELSFKGVISRLKKLEALILRPNISIRSEGVESVGVESSGVESAGISVSELESLPCLEDLQLCISTASFLKGLAHSSKLARCVSHLEITRMDRSCFRLVQELGSMDRLMFLDMWESEMTEVVIEEEEGGKPNTLCNLTVLLLCSLDELIVFRVSMEPKHSLQYLKAISINRCHGLRFAYLGWPLPQLEFLTVVQCIQLEEIFKISGGSGIVFSALRIIHIYGCRMLKIICSDAFCFPSLQILEVRGCEQLKRLPRGVIQASKESLQEIRGSQRWWDELTWDSEEDKISLLPLFKSCGNIDYDSEEDIIGDDSVEDNIEGNIIGVESEEDIIGDDSEEDNIGDDHSEEDNIEGNIIGVETEEDIIGDDSEEDNIGDDHPEEDI